MIGGYIGKPIGGIVGSNAVTFTLTPDSGVYSITGQSAAFQPTLTVTAGSYTLTGQAAAFSVNMPVVAGAYLLTGQAAAFATFEAIASGAYAITGQAAAFSDRMAATAGTYTLTGQGAAFIVDMAVASGSYAITGQAASFGTYEAVGSGAYLLTGQSAAFQVDWINGAGAYVITGNAASFTTTMVVETGVYLLTGNAAPYYEIINGADGTRKRRSATKHNIRLAADRRITVTDRDGQTRKVSYTKRFAAPPPLITAPEWALPEAGLPLPPPVLPALAPLGSAPAIDADYQTALIDMRDEDDIMAFLELPDPLIADIALTLAALAARAHMGRA